MNGLIVILATWFGTGFSPFAQGTMATLLAIPFCFFLSFIPFPIHELTIAAFFFLSCWVSDRAQNSWGKKDDRRIVIDEVMGFFITMMWMPRTPWLFVLGFFLFRFFDILKPPPIRRLEGARGGFGVVLDDVGAGVYSNIVLQIVRLIVR